MGDAVLRVTLLNYSSLASYGVWPNEQEIVDIFFVITYVQGNIELATKQLIDAHKDQMYYLNWKYDIDIPDNATCVSMIFEAVAEDAAESDIGDGKLDIDNGFGTDTYNVDWNINNTSFFGIGTDGGDRGAYLSVKLQVATAEEANVIIINGTGDGGDYGLDEVSPGVYRYSADEQAYLINLNVSSASTHFEQGMNTIILPRAIALECQLNDTLYDLGSMTSSNVLYNASFYSTNMSSSTSSSHIVVVITKNVTAAQAEDILEMLTHNTTGARIGNNVTISPAALYLLHLPGDILSSIPTFIKNEGIGEGPNYLDPFAVISDIAGMAFGFLVWVASGGLLLLFVHLAEMGLKAIGNLLLAYVALVEAAVDAIVDAFMAFVDWMVDFVCSAILAPIQSLCEGIWNGLDDWMMGLMAMIDQFSLGVEGGAISQSSAVHGITAYIINSDLVKIIMAIGLAVFIAMLCIQPMISPYMFVIDLVVPIIMMVILGASSAFGAISSDFGVVTGLEDLPHSFLGSSLTDVSSVILGMIFGVGGAFLSFFEAAITPNFYTIVLFAMSIVGGAIAFWEMARVASDAEIGKIDVISSLLSFSFCGSCILLDYVKPDKTIKLSKDLFPGFSRMAKVTTLIDFGISILGCTIVIDAMVGE